MSAPTKETALQFATMLSCGAPAREAITYFLPEEENGLSLPPAQIEALLQRWMRSKVVQDAILFTQGGDWTEMTFEAKLRFALDKTYTEMAYFLYSRNYAELSGPEKAKADTCRTTLEAKLAGTAGKLNAVEQFWSDVAGGKIKLSGPTSVGPGPEGAKGRSAGLDAN